MIVTSNKSSDNFISKLSDEPILFMPVNLPKQRKKLKKFDWSVVQAKQSQKHKIASQ